MLYGGLVGDQCVQDRNSKHSQYILILALSACFSATTFQGIDCQNPLSSNVLDLLGHHLPRKMYGVVRVSLRADLSLQLFRVGKIRKETCLWLSLTFYDYDENVGDKCVSGMDSPCSVWARVKSPFNRDDMGWSSCLKLFLEFSV